MVSHYMQLLLVVVLLLDGKKHLIHHLFHWEMKHGTTRTVKLVAFGAMKIG